MTKALRDLQQATNLPAAQSPGRLRVLVFATVFPSPRFPLHGTFVLERTRHLAEIADIRVMAPVSWFRTLRRRPPMHSELTDLPVAHPRFWYTPKFFKFLDGLFLFASTVREVGRLRATFKFDLIDAHFAYPDGFAAVLLGRWFRCPVTITLRGTIIPLSRRPLMRWLCNWAIRRATRVIAVAENLAKRAIEGGVPEDRVEVIANGVDSKRFRLIPREVTRTELGLSEVRRLLVSVGHISPRKGFHRIIRALPQVIEALPDTRLAIVGGRGAELDNRESLRALVSELGLEDHVLFVGAQPPDSVARWLGAADVFVLATDFEGCPNVILEAMACGRPVVATKVGDIETMVPAFAGILVDDPENYSTLAEAMRTALTREWDIRGIRDYVSTRSWDDVARRVEAQWRLAVTHGPESASHSASPGEDPPTAAAQSPKL